MLEVTGLTSVLHISSVDEVVEMFCTPPRVIEYLDHAGLRSFFGGPVLRHEFLLQHGKKQSQDFHLQNSVSIVDPQHPKSR